MVGIISSRPWLAVNVVLSEPACSAPCTAAAAPASDCISTTTGTVPQRFFLPAALQASACSAMGLDGVIGKMAMTSLTLWATWAIASVPSMTATALPWSGPLSELAVHGDIELRSVRILTLDSKVKYLD